MSALKHVKCLVWDLDETLWLGILLEGTAGEPRAEVRAAVLELDRRGVLQSIASRNAPEPVAELGLAEYFLYPQVGWGAKSEAVRVIAETLGFSLDTMAFVDDNPVERADVEAHHPAVRVYDSPDGLLDLPDFSPPVTPEAASRRSIYQARGLREAARRDNPGDEAAFRRSLGLRMVIRHAAGADLARVSELTQRTSQMNTTSVVYSVEELADCAAADDTELLIISLEDKFGSYGSIGLVLLRREPGAWRVDLLATSCRVLSVGAGGTLLRWLGDAAYQAGVLLAADFVRTERNRVMEVAYRLAGFESPDELHPGDRTRFVLEPTPTADDGIIHIEAVAPFGGPTPTLWRWSGSQDETVGAEHEVAAR